VTLALSSVVRRVALIASVVALLIRHHGLMLEDVVSGRRSTTAVGTAERLGPEGQYDVALITVRRDQLASVMPALQANRSILTTLFMLTIRSGRTISCALWVKTGRCLVSPGGRDAGRTHRPLRADLATADHARRLERAKQRALARSGGRVQGGRFSDWDIGRHGCVAEGACFFVTVVSGDLHGWGRLPASVGGQRRPNVDDQGVREGFSAVRALGLTVTPFPLRVLFAWLPQWFAVAYWRRFFTSDMADYVFGRHARSAPREMREIASDCVTLLERPVWEPRYYISFTRRSTPMRCGVEASRRDPLIQRREALAPSPIEGYSEPMRSECPLTTGRPSGAATARTHVGASMAGLSHAM
jgi:hypothetical protein